MNTIQSTRCFALKSLLPLLTPIMLFAPHVYAETYVAGQIGMTFPQTLSSGEGHSTESAALTSPTNL